MAIDTRDKRASSINIGLPFGRVFPNPDGSLSNADDRAHMAYSYRGIAATAPVAPVDSSYSRFLTDFAA